LVISQKIKKRIMLGIHNNFYSEKLYNLLNLYLKNRRNKQKILIYAMGKVGSTTMFNSLKDLDSRFSVYHTHFLTKDRLNWAESVYKKNWKKIRYYPGHVAHGKFLRTQLYKQKDVKKWKIVTIVRDPVAQHISMFFEEMDIHLDYGYRDKIKSIGTQKVVQELLELLFVRLKEEDRLTPFSWFDRELKTVFDIDLFSMQFPKTKGYKIYKENRADLLLLKMEQINDCSSDAIAEFLKVDNFSLKNMNIGLRKYYSDSYREILDNLFIPTKYLNEYYSSRQTRHFYSDNEIRNFKDKWREKSATS